MSASAKVKFYYQNIDVWRGICVLWVLLHHINIFFGLHALHLDKILNIGFLGVDFFFIISGFLISGLLFPDLSTEIRWKRFYIRRVFKIIPSYLIVVICGLLLEVVSGFVYTGKPGNNFSYFFFSQNYFVENPLLAHTWSLAIEEHFYLVYPVFLIVMMFLCRKFLKSELLNKKRNSIGIVLIALIVFFNIVRAIFLHQSINPNWAFNEPIIFQKTHFRVDALIFGCLLKLYQSEISQILKRKGVQLILAFLAVCIILLFVLKGFDQFNWYFYTLAYLAFCALMMISLETKNIISSIFAFIPWIKVVGTWSYGIYLWHYLVIYFLFLFFAKSLLLTIICFILSIGINAISTLTIEKYFLNIRKRVAP